MCYDGNNSWKYLTALFLCLGLFVTNCSKVRADHLAPEDFYEQVAAKCNGEANTTYGVISYCAATVRNRVNSGISPYRVLEAYTATPAQYTDKDVQLVRSVFTKYKYWEPKLWFMLGIMDEDLARKIRKEAYLQYTFYDANGNHPVMFWNLK